MNTPWICNVSAKDIICDWFPRTEHMVLIQISEPGTIPPHAPAGVFQEVHQFFFLDADEENCPENLKSQLISDEVANNLANILTRCLERDISIVVHCRAGLCRSGAVAEVGIILGFNKTKNPRIPNPMVKRKLLKALGLGDSTVERDTSPDLFSQSWD